LSQTTDHLINKTITMRVLASSSLIFGLASVVRADKYGYNHVAVRKDSEIVAGAFPDVDIELLSPAFLTPEIRQDGFSDGTQGPTSHDDMGMFGLRATLIGFRDLSRHQGIQEADSSTQMPSSKTLPTRTST
jgi:hypothetical protein